MAKLLIAELGEDQEVVEFFMVRGRQLRTFRDRGGGLLTVRLGDKSGEIDAKVWDEAEQWYRQLRVETVVKVAGRTQVYNGRLELTVARIRVAREDEYAIDDFLPTCSRDRAVMLDEVTSLVSSISNTHLKALLDDVLDANGLRDFGSAPAAKMVHHACLAGLMQHTLEVVKFCQTALEVYPQVDRDLLLTGALLHDIGKIREYVYRRSIDFSDEGRLIGHIVLGEEIVVEHARKIANFPEGLLLRLRHMLISHHGHYEWQSPKRPKTIEATILHLADYFSSQVAIMDASIKSVTDPGASWTEYNRYLDRAVFIGSASPLQATGDDSETVQRLFEERYQGY